MEAGQYAAALSAIILSGNRIERRETGQPGEFDWMDRASEQPLVAFIEQGIVPDAGKLN